MTLRGRVKYRQAIELYEQLIPEHPDQIYLRTGLIETLHEYSSLLAAKKDWSEAEALFRQALEVADTLIDNDAANTHCFTMALAPAISGLAWDLVETAARRIVGRGPCGPPGAADHQPGSPNEASGWRTLGVAYYRLGDWAGRRRGVENGPGPRPRRNLWTCSSWPRPISFRAPGPGSPSVRRSGPPDGSRPRSATRTGRPSCAGSGKKSRQVLSE